MSDLKDLEKLIGYEFKNPDLLVTALTHSSYASEHSLRYERNNERLEFIGDAYLDAVVGNRLFDILNEAHEGMLSRNRADVVCESSLADVARKMGLGEFIFLGKGENANGGRDKDSILADAFEALLGAVIIDGGFDEGKRIVLELFEDKIQLAVEGKLNSDYKTRLQEMIQEKNHNTKIYYVLYGSSGPDHDKTFTVNVVVNDRVLGTGEGKSKAKAEQAAAQDAISKGEL